MGPITRRLADVRLHVAGGVVADHCGDVAERCVPAQKGGTRVGHLGERQRVLLGEDLVDLEDRGAGAVVLVVSLVTGDDRT